MPASVHNHIDEKLYHHLRLFLPKELGERARVVLEQALELFANDRHFDVLACIDGLLKECAETPAPLLPLLQAAVEPANSVDPDAAASTTVVALPSALSIELFMGFIRQSVMYRVASEKVRRCRSLLDDICNRESWQPVSTIDATGSGTFYRFDETTHTHLFKVIGDVPSSVMRVMGVLMELDLYSEWFPFCFHATLQGEVTRFHKASHLAIRLPWPFANRDMFLEGYGVDDLTENRRVVVVSHSLCEDGPMPPEVRPPEPSACVRLEMQCGGFLVEAVSPVKCRVSFIVNVDPKLPHAPMWAVNWASGKLVWAILHEISKTAKQSDNDKSKYAERRRQRPDVYEYLQERYHQICGLHFPDWE
ncbi:hypothetical protein DQ04_03291120 [Trypanosoma grayi]|uniref:hypothetical protein n=1 Tax=Trypanosoma grayi TaxID=71804 RepID=UPI0004F4BA90|nr:hypothetical protein DQ04_03291120 [Trypanosoma grayi]KEG10795.1 hypothetical protein DQ04_03291120 [Trypanosoma grayi]